MSFYEKRILPYLIDLACGIGPIHKQRAKVVPRAQGRVLEIGIGTGLNLQHYDLERLDELWGLDPALELNGLAKKRMKVAGLEVNLLPLPAEEIPAADNHFDSIVCTYTLCTIDDTASALAEMKRVLKPGGELLFSEHGLAPDANVQRWQERINPVWKRMAGGCHLNRDIPHLLRESGFQAESLDSLYLPGPRPMSYHYWGVAKAG
ncbi:MAG: class I SAM-dependent methyltransferase [Oceanococcus sp.]